MTGEPDPTSFPPDLARDKVLSLLVKLISVSADPDAAFPMTLIVGGAIVSGKLISEEAYIRKIGIASFGVAEASPESHVPELLDIWTEDARAELETEQFTPSFIHLADARPFAGPALLENAGLLMRIRLSDVQGFSLSEMVVSRTVR